VGSRDRARGRRYLSGFNAIAMLVLLLIAVTTGALTLTGVTASRPIDPDAAHERIFGVELLFAVARVGTFDVVVNARATAPFTCGSSGHQRDVHRQHRSLARRAASRAARLDRGQLHDHADRRSGGGVLVPLPQPVVLPFKGTFRTPFAMDSHAPADAEQTDAGGVLPGRRLEVSFGP
jgi:hypothetical protein